MVTLSVLQNMKMLKKVFELLFLMIRTLLNLLASLSLKLRWAV